MIITGLSPKKRIAISEIYAAILMIALTVAGFALIAPSLLIKTQTQASDVIAEYQSNALKEGQSLAMIYHHEDNGSIKVGLLNYGTSPVQIKYVFVSLKGQTPTTVGGTLEDAVGPTTPQTCASGQTVAPGAPCLLEIDMSSSPLKSQWTPQSTYAVILYTTTNVAYTFAG